MNRSQEIAYNTLNYFSSDEGFPGGSFAVALLDAPTKADETNLSRLALLYPDEIAAFRLATRHSDGLDVLRARAKDAVVPV